MNNLVASLNYADCEPCSPPVREGENTDASPV